MAHNDTDTLPELPEFGFYYHYKHDPAGEVNNYAYEVIGVGYHTESDCEMRDLYMVQYLPLYDSFVYRLGKGKLNDARPLDMFMAKVTRDEGEISRFTKITDEAVIAQLREIRNRMYPHRAG